MGATTDLGGTEVARLNRVETDVSTLRVEMGGMRDDIGGLKISVAGFGSVLSRIEESITKAQDHEAQRADRSRPNIIAIVSVLITIISIIVGGAWLVGGNLARLDERAQARDREMARVYTQMDMWEHQQLVRQRDPLTAQ